MNFNSGGHFKMAPIVVYKYISEFGNVSPENYDSKINTPPLTVTPTDSRYIASYPQAVDNPVDNFPHVDNPVDNFPSKLSA